MKSPVPTTKNFFLSSLHRTGRKKSSHTVGGQTAAAAAAAAAPVAASTARRALTSPSRWPRSSAWWLLSAAQAASVGGRPCERRFRGVFTEQQSMYGGWLANTVRQGCSKKEEAPRSGAQAQHATHFLASSPLLSPTLRTEQVHGSNLQEYEQRSPGLPATQHLFLATCGPGPSLSPQLRSSRDPKHYGRHGKPAAWRAAACCFGMAGPATGLGPARWQRCSGPFAVFAAGERRGKARSAIPQAVAAAGAALPTPAAASGTAVRWHAFTPPTRPCRPRLVSYKHASR